MPSARVVLRSLTDESDRKAAAVDVAALQPRDEKKKEVLPPRADADAMMDASDRSEGLMREGTASTRTTS